MKFLLYFLEWILEVVLIIIHFPMYLLNEFLPLKLENGKPTQKYPVILVERWFRHNVFHMFPKYYLEKKGFKVYTINHTLAVGTFESSAKKLGDFIEEKKLENAVLIGLSAGGLTILEYLQNQSGWKNTHLFIAVGVPFHGSPLALLFPIFKSLQELQPGSPFFVNIYKEGIKNLDKIYTLTATSDNLVPRKYGQLAGAHNIHVDMVGHNLLHTFWAPTYKKVVAIIENHN